MDKNGYNPCCDGVSGGGGNSKGFIKSALEYNQNVNSITYEEEKLRKYFPQYFDKNGKFDFERFKFALDSENVQYSDEDFSQKESYSFNFVGKKFAHIQCGQEPLTVITPDLEHNNKDENINSENIYIKGDNLEALKHLLNSYEGKIKCIYIDPPYNTGSDDFVYPDNFKYDKQTLIKLGLTEEEAERVETLYGKSTHSAWLTFMLPRLTLARELLSDDGVIFISIDDNEQANLKLLCDEVFGEDNFVALFPWRKRTAKSDVPFGVSQDYEWVVCYVKSFLFRASIEGKPRKYYETPDFPSRPWRIHDMTKQTTASERPNSYFTMINPKNGDEFPCDPNRTWRITKDTFQKYYDANEIVFPGDYDFLNISKPQARYFKDKDMEKDGENFGKVALSTKLPDDIGMSQDGTKEMKSVFNSIVFSFPKTTNFIKYFLTATTQTNDIILDFFSGSATTAHAVMQLNAEDGGNRKYILVNIPEPTKENSEAFKAGYKTICDIGIARIKKAAEKIKNDTNADIDYGFKIYELNTLSERTLNDIESFEEANSKLFADDMRTSFEFGGVSGEDTILQTWKVDDGFGFIEKHEEVSLNDCLAYKVKKVLYLINPTMNDFVKPLIEKLENELKDVNKIVVLGYSYTFVQLQSLDINIKNFNDIKGQADRVKVEVRY